MGYPRNKIIHGVEREQSFFVLEVPVKGGAQFLKISDDEDDGFQCTAEDSAGDASGYEMESDALLEVDRHILLKLLHEAGILKIIPVKRRVVYMLPGNSRSGMGNIQGIA
jgi:hypothetical protein